jgi:hypothetical protein
MQTEKKDKDKDKKKKLSYQEKVAKTSKKK